MSGHKFQYFKNDITGTLRERFELLWRSAPPVFKIGTVVCLATSTRWFRVESNIDGVALVRELHVYGPLVGVGLKSQAKEWQHRGYGEELLAKVR